MARERLTDKTVRRAAPKSGQIELWDDLVPGFGVRIAAGGARTYFVMKRVTGKLLRRTVGPAVGPGEVANGQRISLGDAREKARVMLASMADGRDPGRTRVARARPVRATVASDKPQEGTFGWVAEKYLADKLEGGGADLRTRPELERKLKVDLADWLRRPIEEIKGRDIRELVREKAQTSPVSANRLLSFVKRVFRWASSQDYVDADPAAAVSKPGKESVRERFLSEDEIRLVWKAAGRLGYPAGHIVRLALVTGQRRGEIAGLRRSELGRLEYRMADPRTGRDTMASGEAWLLPAERTKRGVAHAVPLSKLALSIIAEAPELEISGEKFDHVFATGKVGDTPTSGWSTYKSRLDAEIGKIMAQETKEEFDAEKHVIGPWVIHDLRATFASHLVGERLGIPQTVVSRILNHAEGDGRSMTARYIRHTWDKEAADALDRWAAEIERIVGANVLDLAEVRR